MKKTLATLLFAGASLLAGAAQAAVINGTIHNIDGDNDGVQDDLKISRVQFNVTAGTTVFFDSLVWESTGVDLNGDGRVTGFDNWMTLYSPSNTVLAQNDDSGATFGDGSVHHYDSTINHFFANAGTYTITLGQLFYAPQDGQQGYQANRLFSDYSGIDGFDTFGAWRLTMTASNGTVSNVHEIGEVPEPATTALLGLGLLGFAASRRRKQ